MHDLPEFQRSGSARPVAEPGKWVADYQVAVQTPTYQIDSLRKRTAANADSSRTTGPGQTQLLSNQ
jgi:hypothetical protein